MAGVYNKDTNKQLFYTDGNYDWQTNNGRTQTVTANQRDHFCIVVNSCSATITYQTYDLYAFSTALSAADIQKIYQHDNQ